ncbi:MAG: hypothetical protein M3441_07515 [Chloroflexota bacterium]|nr:hypothetical protein [Chloroflexota bacterium]
MSAIAQLDEAAKARLWERTLHEDTLLNDRVNFFVVFESALFGVFGVLYTTGRLNIDLMHFVSTLGLIFTSILIVSLFKQKRKVDGLERLIIEAGFEEYIISREMAELKLFGLAKIRSGLLLAVIVPLIIALLWFITLIFI